MEIISLRIATIEDKEIVVGFGYRLDKDEHIKLNKEEKITEAILNDECLIISTGNEEVGFVIFDYRFFDHGWIELIIIDEEHRGKGIAGKVFDLICAQCQTHKVFTSTNSSNTQMQKALTKADFSFAGELIGLDDGDPELFYYKKLNDPKNKDCKIMRQEKYISIENDFKLYVETYGEPDNEACLFISGAGANSSFWSDHLCDSLVKNRFFVIKYDHRDFGYSSKIDWDEKPYEFMQLANDALTILDSLNIEKSHIIGHSMGGFIVQLLGIHYPKRVISMTSISSSTNSPSVPMPPEKTWEIYLANKPQNNLETDLNGFLKVWEYLNGSAKFDKDLAIVYTKNLYERQNIDGVLGATHVKSMESLTDRTEELKKVKIPTLVMHGEEDHAMNKYGGIQTAETIENAELILIPKMGHMLFNREILKRFENNIIRFIIKNKKCSSLQ